MFYIAHADIRRIAESYSPLARHRNVCPSMLTYILGQSKWHAKMIVQAPERANIGINVELYV